MSSPAIALERRRQVLLARVSLQRFALRGDLGSLRASVHASAWRWPLALATLGVAARWVPVRRHPLAIAIGLVRWVPLALRYWKLLARS